MALKQYENGWVRLQDSECDLIREYWLDGFDITEEQIKKGESGQLHAREVSPIYAYDDGGIGPIQWVNVTRDVAAVLCQDGGWRDGGHFHLWISPGRGRRPYEVPIKWPMAIKEGDHTGWATNQNEAAAIVEQFLGLRPMP